MKEKRYAILIASSRFPNESRLEDLRFPENDVDGLHRVLTSKERGRFNDVVLLKNSPYYEIQEKIHEVLNAAGKSDLVLIYFSGHGKRSRLGRLCLTATNTDLNRLETTTVQLETVKTLMDASYSKKKILMLDCCYSGLAGSSFSRSGVDDELQNIASGHGTYILTASTAVQTAQEKEADKYGVFTKHIVEGIESGEADLDGDGFIAMDELYKYVHDRVCEEGCQEPMRWDLNVKGDIFIARSGKIPNEARKKHIRKLILNLADQDILPDTILLKALTVLTTKPKKRTPDDARLRGLLDQIYEKRMTIGDFIIQWHQISTATTPIAEVRPKETVEIKPEAKTEPVTVSEKTPPPESEKAQTADEYKNAIGMIFRYIQPGTFMMGSPKDEPGRFDNEILHEVTLTKGFYMQTTQVTQGQWQAVMGNNPSKFKDCGKDCPVESVSWNDVQGFIKKLNEKENITAYRLPTEAEWEYACRAGSQTAYHWGAKADCSKANYGNSSFSKECKGVNPGKPMKVSSFLPNAWGLYDMHGNVWEWCQDWYGGYTTGLVTDPVGPENGSDRVLRGGSWNYDARGCRSADRYYWRPDSRGGSLGFRLVREAP